MADIAVLGLRVDASGAIVATDTLARRLNSLGTESVRAEKGVASLVGSFIGFAAATAALQQAVAEARRFSDAMAEVSTLLADTSSIDGLTSSVRELSAAFGQDAAAEAKALYQIISAGAADAADAIATLTAANRLAVGGVTDVATAADGLTSILNAFGPAVGSAADVSDALFTAMRAGKTTIAELSANIGTVAPIAATLGVSLEDVLAATAALTKGGVGTSVAITGLRATLAAITKPSSEASAEAARLGIEFNSTALRAKGLQQFLVDLNTATEGNTDSLAQFFGGVEALVPVLGLVGASAADYAAILGDMANKTGQTEVAFTKIANSPGFKMDQLLASAKNEALGLGLAFLNVLAPALDAVTANMRLLVEAVAVAGTLFAAGFLQGAIVSAGEYVRALALQRAATVAAAEAALVQAQAAVAAARTQTQAAVAAAASEAATAARRLAIAETQLRAQTSLAASANVLSAAQARVNVEMAFGAAAAARLAAAQAAAATSLAAAQTAATVSAAGLAAAQVAASASTALLTTAMTAAATAGRAMWTAIGGPIGAVVIALYAVYKIFFDNTKAIAAMGDALQGARDRASEYGGTLGTLSASALKAAEAQERLNLATLSAQLKTTGAALVTARSGTGEGGALVNAQNASKSLKEYNALLVQAEEATGRLTTLVKQRGVVEQRTAQDAIAAATAAKQGAADKTKEFTAAAAALGMEIEKQNELNAANGQSALALADISAAYTLRAKVAKISADFAGEEAAQLIALATALAAAEASSRKLEAAERSRLKGLAADKDIAENAAKNAKAQLKLDKELTDALEDKAKARARGAQTAAKEIATLEQQISLYGKTAEEVQQLADAYLFAEKQAQYLAAGLDVLAANVAAQKFVDKTRELRELSTATQEWGDALGGINNALRNLSDSLGGDAQKVVKFISSITNSIEVLIRARKEAAKAPAVAGSGGFGAKLGGAFAVAGAGFAAGSAIGGMTTSKTKGSLGGAASGALAGAALGSVVPVIGTAVGAIIGGAAGFIGGLLGSAKKAREAAQKMKEAQATIDGALNALRATFDDSAPIDKAINEARKQFAELREATAAAFAGGKNSGERNTRLAELNVLEGKRVGQLQAQFTEQQKVITQDLEVRKLRAAGQAEAADSLALALAQQREYADAVAAGATSTTLVALSLTQMAEAAQLVAAQEAAAAEARQRAVDAQMAFDKQLDSSTKALTTFGLQRELDTASEQFDALRESLRLAFADSSDRTAYEARLRDINALEAIRTEQLTAEFAAKQNSLTADLGVRGLRAGGNTDEADLLARKIAQEREYADAVRAGFDATTLAILAQTQAAETTAAVAAIAERKRLAEEAAATASAEASERALNAQKAFDTQLRASADELGKFGLQRELANASKQFDDLRKALAETFAGSKDQAGYRARLKDINALEAQRLAQVETAYKAAQAELQADLTVRRFRADGNEAEADALAFKIAQEREYIDALRNGADATTLRTLIDTQAAERTQRATDAALAYAAAQEVVRRSLSDLATSTLAFSDPRGASDASFAEAQARRVFDAIAAGASAAEQAAIGFFNAAEAAARAAERVESDTRRREALVGRGLAASGDVRGAEDANRNASQRQELADAIREGQSPANIALLKFVQFAERSQVQMLRAIEDGTKAIQQRAKDEIAANNLLIEVIRTDSAKQLAKLDQQIEATELAARAASMRFDEQIGVVKELASAQLKAIDAQIEAARGTLEAAQQQVESLESLTQTNEAVLSALTDFTNSSKLGDLSTLSPEEKLAEARAQFEALAGAAGGGDAQAAQGLPAAANALLQASRGFNASGSGFVADFNRVQDVVGALTTQFGASLPIDKQQLEAAKLQVIGINAQIESLGKQKEAVQEASEKSIALLELAKETAAADAQRIIDALNAQKDTVSADALAQIERLEALNQTITDGVQLQIDALVAVENEAHKARLAQDSYWTTYLGLLAEGSAALAAGGTGEPTPIVLTAENNPVAAAQLEEQRKSNSILTARLEALEEQLTRVVDVAVAASADEVSVGNRIVSALALVAAETRNAAQAAAARTPVPRR